MPMVHIHHANTLPPALCSELPGVVHDALVRTFDVPTQDFFQTVTPHTPGTGLLVSRRFLDIEHTPNVVMVQIVCAAGRTVAQKRALYAALADGMANRCNLRREDVIVTLIETARENWSFGKGEAPFAGEAT